MENTNQFQNQKNGFGLNAINLKNEIDQRGAICFYHCDHDGRFANQVIRQAFNKVRSYSVNYNRKVPYDIIPPDAIVFLVDFSFPLEDMKRIASQHRLIWCDHHDPINSYINSGFYTEGNRRIEPGVSGTTLVWEMIYGDKPMPKALQLVAKYDTWQIFDDPDVLDFNMGLGLLSLEDNKACEATWTKLFTDDSFTDRIIEAGKHIKEFDNLRAKIMCEDCAYHTSINGLPALAINVKNTNSKVLDSVDPNNEISYRVLYCWFGNIQKYRVSVYSTDETKYSVADFCRQYGGNGRDGCGGFVCDKLPFEIPHAYEPKPNDNTNKLLSLKNLIDNDPLVRKHSTLSMRQTVGSILTNVRYYGWNAAFINHPGMLVDAFYETGFNFNYDIGVFWSMLSSGWYKLIIYPLNTFITLDQITEKTQGIKGDNCVIVYQNKPPVGNPSVWL